MDISIIIAIIFFILVIIPINSVKAIFIKSFGFIICSMILIFYTNWSEIKEFTDLHINHFYEWLMIKADNDPKKASNYISMFIIVIMQPIIFGAFYLYKKVQGMK